VAWLEEEKIGGEPQRYTIRAEHVSTLLKNDYIYINSLQSCLAFTLYVHIHYIHTTLILCCRVEGADWAHILLSGTGTAQKVSMSFSAHFPKLFSIYLDISCKFPSKQHIIFIKITN
jgi:hypothetical protein